MSAPDRAETPQPAGEPERIDFSAVNDGQVLEQVDRWLRRRAVREARHRLEDKAFERAVEDFKQRRAFRAEAHERGLSFIDRQVAELLELLRGTGLRSWTLPSGRVGWRKNPVKYDVQVTDEELVRWLRQNVEEGSLPKGAELPVKEEVKLSVPRRMLVAFIKATGLLPDGVAVIEGVETVVVQANPAGPDLLAIADELDPEEGERTE